MDTRHPIGRGRRIIPAALAFFMAAVAPVAAPAQDLGLAESAILVVDPNRLFVETAFGKRVEAEIEAESADLAAENRRIEAELADEERALTAERPGMDPLTFRAKADAFDAKVTRIRSEQEQKAIALATQRDEAQRRFLAVARPVLEELMVESRAVVLLDTRAVLISTRAIDVTDAAVLRIDQAIGTGDGIEAPQTPSDPSSAQE